MLDRHAIAAFSRRQRAILVSTYDKAWRAGRDGYVPDADPPAGDRHHVGAFVPAGLGASAVLLARRAVPYVAPPEPQAAARDAALRPAFEGLDRMQHELANLIPAPEHAVQADAAVASGEIDPARRGEYAMGVALASWAASNAFRLDAGESAAWAGEQDGYAAAADADGQLLEWQTEDDDAVCADCADLGNLPPMPLSDWPTQPGYGDTACSVGCRCSLEATSELAEGDALFPLSDQANAVLDRVAQTRSEAMAGS